MAVREAGDVIFYRSAQQSISPRPWRKGMVGFLQAWSFIRQLQRKGREARDFQPFTSKLISVA